MAKILSFDKEIISIFNTFSKQKILDSSKLKEIANNNFEFGENGKKFFKQVDKTVGNVEIVPCEQFLFSHTIFKRLVLPTCKNQGLFRKG